MGAVFTPSPTEPVEPPAPASATEPSSAAPNTAAPSSAARTAPATIVIPPSLLPADGRFGSGPSRVRPAQVEALAAVGSTVLGTSHRQAPVRDLVRRAREGLAQLLGAPDGHEVVLGNGGSTSFWDAATFSLVRSRAHHAVHGEFSGKFAAATTAAPFLEPSEVVRAEPGTLAVPDPSDAVDVVAWAHNETSTGVVSPVRRPPGAPADALTLVDATSIAGAAVVDLTQADAYYFAPQKVFGSDGGLWLAVVSPAAVDRIGEIAGSGRWIPESLSLDVALTNSRLDQTLNTPAIATLVLLVEQVEWFLDNGGLDWAAQRSRRSTDHVYAWAQAREWATPFVLDPAHRSPVVATVDLVPEVDATAVIRALRDNGVLDVFPYRKLGRNQLRIGAFPAVEPEDVEALTACVDFVVERL
ncbi:MAG TPA: phosphoserine transaminase [Micrococcales bacterium]|nr:phosphoserine transaminase [Micrococcales bacterium]